jgi:8-oxo-dGTP diphosphatase
MLTADAAVFALLERPGRGGRPGRPRLGVVLVRRRNAPFRGRWALPGGFVGIREPLLAAARRELAEETGLRGVRLEALGLFAEPGRDPRGRVATAVFWGLARPAGLARLAAGDDAREAGLFDARRPPPLAFDHDAVLRRALARLAEREAETPGELAARLLPARGGRSPATLARARAALLGR